MTTSQPHHRHMDIDPATNRAVREFLKRASGQYEMAGAILYGSRARGTHQPDSDADIAILLRGSRRQFWPTLKQLSGAAFDVLLETDIKISPLPIWEDEWEHPETHSNPELLKNIAREGVRI